MIGVIYKETIIFKVYLHIKLIYSFNIILENTQSIKLRIKRSNILENTQTIKLRIKRSSIPFNGWYYWIHFLLRKSYPSNHSCTTPHGGARSTHPHCFDSPYYCSKSSIWIATICTLQPFLSKCDPSTTSTSTTNGTANSYIHIVWISISLYPTIGVQPILPIPVSPWVNSHASHGGKLGSTISPATNSTN